MVRLSDLDPDIAETMRNAVVPTFDSTPWVTPPDLLSARVAIVSTAGIHRVDDVPFTGHDGDYCIVPGDVEDAGLTMTHLSVNFDRAAYQQDVNVAFPLARLRTLAENGEIGSVASWHYSFMGATPPEQMERSAREVARLLAGDNVDLALLIPI